MTRIHITTLGCPKNTVDSGHLERAFAAEGFSIADEAGESDVLLVNTCGFIKDAKEESIDEILKLAQLKEGGRKLLVFGCLAARYRDELMKEIPEIDGIWGVGEERRIIEYCKGVSGYRSVGVTEKRHSVTPIQSSYAYLKIAEGCNKKCTFCVIPSIRGGFRSIPSETILGEAEEYVRGGTKELILVAQDITSYGKETGGYNLVSLLKDMASISGDFHVRLLYLYPTAVDEELIGYMAAEDKICKYLDVPLQHSEDRMLRLMGRRGSRKEYIRLLRTIRRAIPQIALRTTFIVGFPSETEEDFNGLVDFIEEVRFDRLGVFKFSKEEGTPSAKLKGQVPEKVKERRLDELMRRQAGISLEKNRELVGRRYDALVDEVEDNLVIARLYSHAPEIDGVVIIERQESGASRHASKEKDSNSLDARRSTLDARRSLKDSNSLDARRSTLDARRSLKVGDTVTVEIVDAYDYDVKGRLVMDGEGNNG